MRTYEITNERTGEKITVSGKTVRDCQLKAAKATRNKKWVSEDVYHSDEVEPKGLLAWITRKLKTDRK